mmetsp:Transcript_11131/g.29374  ORF Transcript_11131/g.29374 Transcript_11131/m.29374 type:complete len:118 (+) Transcript_11131:612-965(+)
MAWLTSPLRLMLKASGGMMRMFVTMSASPAAARYSFGPYPELADTPPLLAKKPYAINVDPKWATKPLRSALLLTENMADAECRCPTKDESSDAMPKRQKKLTSIGQPMLHIVFTSSL